jgi:lipid II:glycine glycyltransferase (peptidoglycan interpeptide bridge formation enzyme)
MNVVEIDLRDKFSFNQFVAKNNGSFLQSWEWGGWQEALGRKVYRLAISEIIDGNAETVASMQIIKMPLPFNKYYLYAPYGPVIDRRFKIEDLRLLTQELQGKFRDAVFIRIEPKENVELRMQNAEFVKTKNIQPGRTLIIDLNKSEEELLAEMHHKTRYNIRLAEKHGVKIEDEFALTVGKGIYAQEAVKLIAETAKRQSYKAQGEQYFENLVDFFAVQNSKSDVRLHIYKAVYNKELLAIAFLPTDPKKQKNHSKQSFADASEKNLADSVIARATN